MVTTSQGRYLGTDSSFKYRKSKGVGSGLKLGAQRKDSLEKKAIDDKEDQEQAKAKEISRRQKEREGMRKELKGRVAGVSEATDANRNTEARRRVVNVSRPDTAKNPMDPRSKLAKQGEIEKKIIENEVRSMTLQKYHNLPDSLVAAVKDVLEGKNPFAKDDKATKKDDDKDDADDKKAKASKDDDSDDEPKSKKDDSDDDQDKMVGKDGKKTKVDVNPAMKMANEELKGGQKKLDKNKNGRLDAHDFKMLRKEEVEEIDELSNKTLRSYAVQSAGHLRDIKPAWIRHADYEKGAAVGAHGKTAQKRQLGGELASKKIKQNIAKGNAAANEEVSLSDEETARILAKLNEADDEDQQDGLEHIVMQLRKAKSLGAANSPIHFHDGSKVNVASGHVQKALDMHGSFKKAPDKDEFTQKLQASHASFKKAIGEG